MKLIELEPRWGQDVMMNRTGSGQSNFAPAGFRNVILFLCPHCLKQRLAVTFEPPIGPLEWVTPGQPVASSGSIWTRESGETFETLSLSPSVDTTANPAGRIDFQGHWHGHIKNGEVA